MPSSLTTAAADAGGRALAAVTAGLTHVRSAAKPLHPEGQLYAGRLLRAGQEAPSGVAWLDEPAEDDVIVRVSRAIGLPDALPDFHGLALRINGGWGDADLLFASTGWDPVTRHLLLPRWSPARPLTTLLPYRTEAGPVVLGARATDRGYDLSWAPLGRAWRPLGRLDVGERLEVPATVSFDPVVNRPPGLQQYGWVVRLRERSYATARSHRGEPGDTV